MKIQLLVLSKKNNPQLPALAEIRDIADIHIGSSFEELHPWTKEAEALLYWEGDALEVEKTVKASPSLKWLHSKSVGINPILFPSVVDSQICLTNSRGVYASSLSEFAFCGMLFFAKDLSRMNRNKAARCWEQFTVDELRGKTLGIFGYGAIGRETAQKAKAFGMNVIAIRRSLDKQEGTEWVDETLLPSQRRDLCSRSDYLLISAALTPETEGAIGRLELSSMKPEAVLINVGRGAIVDEEFLIECLRGKRIRGAALDVVTVEPLPIDSPIWELENVILSPHTADHTQTWKDDTMRFYIENVRRYAEGQELLNICDKQAGY